MLTWTAFRPSSREAATYDVKVSAGPFDRQQTVTTVPMPEGAADTSYQLIDEQGRATPLQTGGEGTGWFILDRLAANETRTFRLMPAPADDAHVTAREAEGTVSLAVDGAPVFQYHAKETDLPRPDVLPIYRRGGYLHPVLTPSGTLVTDDYPPNHLHHHGIWAAWTKTEFEGRTPDFWNMGDSTGTVEPVALDTIWQGPVHGGFRARHQYVDLSASGRKVALAETWAVQVYRIQEADQPYFLFDLTITQHTATDSPLVLPAYRYGGVGFRGHRQWDGAENAFFLTSEGKDRSDGHATTARWCHIGGYVDGTLAGVAFLGHPDNFRAPQPMRIHPNEPFFNWAPSQAGDWAIQPGEPYVARYRYVVADGPPDAARLDRLWNDYAHPPTVVVAPVD